MSISGQPAVVSPVSRFADRAYLAWAAVATAYAIAFLQRVSPQAVSLSFMQDFGTDAGGVAMLASSYFWGYTLMQIPAGLLVDRYGVKLVVLFSMAASSVGSAAFALAPNLLDVFAALLLHDFAQRCINVLGHPARIATHEKVGAIGVDPVPNFGRIFRHLVLDVDLLGLIP